MDCLTGNQQYLAFVHNARQIFFSVISQGITIFLHFEVRVHSSLFPMVLLFSLNASGISGVQSVLSRGPMRLQPGPRQDITKGVKFVERLCEIVLRVYKRVSVGRCEL